MRAHLATVQHRPRKALPYVVVVRVGNSRRSTSFAVKRAALAHQARLNAAVNAGEDFDPRTGEPVSWATAGPQDGGERCSGGRGRQVAGLLATNLDGSPPPRHIEEAPRRAGPNRGARDGHPPDHASGTARHPHKDSDESEAIACRHGRQGHLGD